jgi:hypothetical protein
MKRILLALCALALLAPIGCRHRCCGKSSVSSSAACCPAPAPGPAPAYLPPPAGF